RKVIDSGVLGRIVQINVAASGFSRRWDWQTLQELDGGNLLNTGPHPLDQVLRLLDSPVMPEVHCFMDRANTYGNAEDHVLVVLRAPRRPLIHLEVSSCCAYPSFVYNVYGTRGGLKGNSSHLDWKYFYPSRSPKHKATRKPIATAEGLPAYCREKLKWTERSWDVPPRKKDLFGSMAGKFYSMLYKTLTTGAPLVITPQHVRQQIAIIQACQKQNPHIYKR
ncbi:hypothetical protein LCGC14_2800760, partial [marine sediment metagenome]